ncbi:hypothetical protein NIES2101_00300 [Calothrix sp. HK-06]|nr:hypothetical protein NIES2101_00300 [Calothrix sp. HK-06]
MAKITKFVKKIFGFLRNCIHFLWELIDNALHLIVFAFSYLTKILASPSTPCVVAIIAFGAVTAIAAGQWYSIGVWLGSKLGASSGILGVGSGTAGVLLGLGINVYQLAPQLWKLRRDIAQAYAALKIDTEFQSEGAESVNERNRNWLSYDHGELKRSRLISYAVETGLVLSYCFFTGLNFFSIVTAAISLLLPEKCLTLVSSTVSLLGKVSDHLSQEEADHASL